MGSGGDKTFGQYLESLGLSEKKAEPQQVISPKDLATLKRLSKEKH